MSDIFIAAAVFGVVLGIALYLCRTFIPDGNQRSGCCPNLASCRALEERKKEEAP